MKIKLLLLCAFTFFAGMATAQKSGYSGTLVIHGYVIAGHGMEPAAFANVLFKYGTVNGGVATDFDGNFKYIINKADLAGVKTISVTIALIGYRTKQLEIPVDKKLLSKSHASLLELNAVSPVPPQPRRWVSPPPRRRPVVPDLPPSAVDEVQDAARKTKVNMNVDGW